MKEVAGKIVDYFSNRNQKSPFYKILFYSYLICNWKMLYLAFWQNGDLFFESQGITKYEYIVKEYSIFDSFNHSINIENIFFILVCPFVLTILIIWIFPWITDKALNKHLSNLGFEENLIKKNELESKKIEVEIIDNDKKIDSGYNKDYKEFKSNLGLKDAFDIFSDIIIRIDHHGGRLGYIDIDEHTHSTGIPDKLISKLVSLNIIEKDGYNFKFTTKGDVFRNLFVKDGFLGDLKVEHDIPF